MVHNVNRTLLCKAMSCCFLSLLFLILSSSRLTAGEKQPVFHQIDSIITTGGYQVGSPPHITAEKNATTLFVPASTLKIVTSLASLRILGENFRFRTDFFLTKDNDLYIKGYGDPFLTSEEITGILNTLREKGVTTINNIFLDAGAFQLNGQADGRSTTLNPYDAANSALAANFNTINFIKHPNGTISSAEPQTPTLPIMVRLGKNLPPGTQRINLTNNNEDILIHTGELFRALQNKSGIMGSGKVAGKAVPVSTKHILSHYSSQTLKQVIEGLLRYSNNFIANQLFLTCGAKEKGYPATWEKSREVFHDFLSSLGLDSSQITMVEGSGLSRNNLITPATMIKILQEFRPYAHLLYMDNGRLIKSGTMTGVYCYTGYFPRGLHLIPYAVMLNQPKNIRDQLLNLLEKSVVSP